MTNNLKPLTRKEKILDGQNINPINRDEYFIQKAVQSGGGGGGSSLPPYTSADKGKVLTVVEAEPETVVVVPEQSGTLSAITYDLESTAYGAILDGVNTSDLANEQSISFTGSFGQDTSTMTLYYLADSNVFVTALDETGDIIVFLAEVDGQNKWIFNSYDPSTVGLAYTISATASVPSVEPKWEKGNIVMPISQQFTTMFMTRLTAEVPKAIQAGVGVPVYAPAATEAATNEAEWDNAVSLIEKSFNEGVLPVFYATAEDLIGAKSVTVSQVNNAWSVSGLSTYYATNGYTLLVEFGYVLTLNPALSNRKSVGISTVVTLLDTP